MSAYSKGFNETMCFFLNKILVITKKIQSNNFKKDKFNDNNTLKEGSQIICISVILIDSVFRIGKNYYP